METPQSSLTGDIAVSMVQVIVGKQLSWIVRPQLLADKGIDAHIEVVQNGNATGRLLALQVKGGKSWFKEPTADGFVFRPKPKHVEYWLGHSLPVAVVLVDVDKEIAYWQLVTEATVTSTEKGWKMTIPTNNTFSMPAASALLAASEGDAYTTLKLDQLQLNPPWMGHLAHEDSPADLEDWISKMSDSVSLLLTALDEDGTVVARYWAHARQPEARSAGQGRKIVPTNQWSDDEHAAAWHDLPLSRDTPPSLEGSALGPPRGTVPQECELRYALIAPRLVAPHPNFNSERAISAAEGVALLAQGRFRDLKYRADRHPDVPDPEDPHATDDWTWRFVAAIWDWAINDSITSLEAVQRSAPNTGSAAASGVFVACVLSRLVRHGDAITALTPLVEDDDMDSVDRAWALVQRARAYGEIGDLPSCRGDALAARDLLTSDSDDITVSAISAAVEWHLSITARAQDRDYRPTVAASDTQVSWWRSQWAGWGLAKAVDAGFRQWAQELSITIGGTGDQGEMELFGVELCADMAGEHSAWKTFASLGARLQVQHARGSSDEKAQLIEGLDALRRCGDDKALRLAIRRLVWDGPIDVAASAVSRVHPDEWTRTTVPTNFTALETAGDLLDEDAAAGMLVWLAHLASDGTADFIDRYQPTLTINVAAYKAMASLIPAAAHNVHSRAAAFVAAQRTDLPNVMARQLAAQLDWIRSESVDDASRAALRRTAFAERSYLGTRILGWLAANDDPEARQHLMSHAAEGDLDALAELGDVLLLDDPQAAALIALLDERARQVLSEMRARTYDTGSINTLDALTLLNLQFPEVAKWPVVHEVLSEPLALADQKTSMCARIAAFADRLPTSERNRIVADIDAIATAAEGFWPGTRVAGLDVVIAVALGAIGADQANAAVTQLALGSEQKRANAARLLGLGHCPGMRPVLTQLIRDPHPPVRAQAARSVGKLAARTPDTLSSALARDIVNSTGMLLPGALLAGLSLDSPQLNDISEELATDLQHHPSARIRHQARRLLQA